MPYQSFHSHEGDSSSQEKLDAIHLPKDLTGLSVLDLGCNEGFFSIEAKRRGADSVVGIDTDENAIRAAHARAPDIDFRCDSWENLPDQGFDLVLMLSALHYARRPVQLLDSVAAHMTPNGLFILECGVVRSPERSTVWTQRGMVVYHPTWNLLFDDYLRSFGAKLVNKSVSQSGDPVPRYVFHCRPRKPFVLIAPGPVNAGKTSLAHELTKTQGQRVSTDRILSSLESMRKANTPLLKLVNGLHQNEIQNKAHITRRIINAGLEEEFTEIIFDHLVLDVPLIVIEGYSLTPSTVRYLTQRLQDEAIVRTVTQPSANHPYASESEPGERHPITKTDSRPRDQLEAIQRARNNAEKEAAALRRDNDKLRSDYQRLRGRRSVRLALSASTTVRPLFRLLRRFNRSR
jgi:SAM-dependent methyltransferase